MEGEGEITLSSLLEKLGVTEITAADVANVTFSNPEYIAIEQLDSDWLLRSLAPFSTEEALTLTLQNGQSVEIKVTDEQQEEPAPTPVANLVYDGQPQNLVTVDAVDGVTFSYALGENGDTAPVDDESWRADIPTATNAGTYYVWYKADGSDTASRRPKSRTVICCRCRPNGTTSISATMNIWSRAFWQISPRARRQ